MLLLNFVALLGALSVIEDGDHLVDHSVNFGGADAVPVLGVVEVLGCTGRLGAYAKARNAYVVLTVTNNLREFRLCTRIELEVNADFLHALNEGLCLALGGGVITKGGQLQGDGLAVLRVEVAGLGVACLLQDLACFLRVTCRVVVAVVLGVTQQKHRAGNFLFVRQTLEANLCQSTTVDTQEDCLTDSNIGDVLCVQVHTTGEEAATAADFRVRNVLHLVVGAEGT